ncbi:MAG TPA: SPFH domain-containing protein [Bacteroidia bacterium]|jgi:regulator of protease activity HflC (stomatin/prohibitin superfamily)|nr:SPFH domain-containing protein [Bacteroidia bacterium]
MKKFIVSGIAIILLASCAVVPAGYKGVKVYLLGRRNGSELKVLDVGRYRMGWNQRLYLFPMFQQDFTWGHNSGEPNPSPHDPFNFQSKEGINVSVDLGISFHIAQDSVKNVFMKWRRDINYIANVYFDDLMHDALIHVASTMSIEQIYGTHKKDLLEKVDSIVEHQVRPYGIVVDRIFYTSDLKLPDIIVKAINAKMEATQIAQQRENELREVEAEANKKIAQAKGESESKMIKEKNQFEINFLNAQTQAQMLQVQTAAQANATVVQAKADSSANKMKQSSINDKIIELMRIEKWDGHMPTYTGSSNPNITLPR